MSNEPTDRASCGACGRWWRFPALLAIVLAALLLSQSSALREVVFPARELPSDDLVEAPSDEHVLLTINFGDGRMLENKSARWKAGMTVADVLQGDPRISFSTRGSGESAFLTQLNGVANEGAGGRNWLYSVNGKQADRSFGVYALEPNDHVLWTFAKQD